MSQSPAVSPTRHACYTATFSSTVDSRVCFVLIRQRLHLKTSPLIASELQTRPWQERGRRRHIRYQYRLPCRPAGPVVGPMVCRRTSAFGTLVKLPHVQLPRSDNCLLDSSLGPLRLASWEVSSCPFLCGHGHRETWSPYRRSVRAVEIAF